LSVAIGFDWAALIRKIISLTFITAAWPKINRGSHQLSRNESDIFGNPW